MTALGLNNYGKQVYRYGLEDIDVDENGEEVFRESDSTFFCRIRDLFSSELKAMYNTLESKNTWHAESFINKADAWQSEFSEELWRLDIERKYKRTYNESFINGEGDAQFLTNMANGKMKYQRRQWERSQEKYMASKYQSSVASSDNSVFRCSVPSGDLAVKPNYRLKLTPYAYMYLNVKYGTQSPIQLRAVPNVEYEIPFEGEKADIVDVYSASLIQDFGDLSSCYVATADTSKASKVKRLIFGNDTEGYDNPSFTTLTTGANYLLEVLNIENVSGLNQALNLSALNNLRELYAHGSNVGGVTFADGGKIEIAELPAISSVSMKNLVYLVTLDITDLSKLTTLTVENCNTVDLLTILEQAPNVNRVRITGIDWTLEDTSLLDRIYDMYGIDRDGYNTDQAVLAGKVSVPVIREQRLREYNEAWPDLEIKYNTMIEQFPVTFANYDGTVLEVQYVDKGGVPVDPLTREDNPLATPTRESSVSTDYTFAGWDSDFVATFGATTITATYSEAVRNYTVTYKAMGVPKFEKVAPYGSMVFYEGDIPTYTAEETAYKYYLFTGWDSSGYVTGDKVVNAVYDVCEYTANYFDGKDLASLRPVELYAMTQLSMESQHITDKDRMTVELGHDYSYSDIEEHLIISEKTDFNGSNYIDTGLAIMDEDRDFVIAIDYAMSSTNSTNAVLAQCYQADGVNGFKLWYNAEPKLSWGTSTYSPSALDKREMMVLRHIKGETGLHVYMSNLAGSGVSYNTLSKARTTVGVGTLVLGCAKADDGAYENYAIGSVYWCKVWYADLGDDVCRELASWTHEKIGFEACGFKRYYLSANASKRCSITFLASDLLSRPMALSNTQSSAGGWANATLNSFLNTRLYAALPIQWKQLVKQVKISSSIGDKSTEISTSDCYIAIPSAFEVDPTKTAEPYCYEGTSISYLTSNQSRICSYVDGDPAVYWLRSPNVDYTNYFFRVAATGELTGFSYSYNEAGIRVMFSI